jgi:cysteine-rich repeat protein
VTFPHKPTLGAFLGLVLVLTAAQATAGVTERLSVHSTGTQATGASSSPSCSADGRFVAFASDAADLVDDDTNGFSDIFVRDRVAETTERVSLHSSGAEANANSFAPAISADGRYVAFESDATNLVDDDTNARRDVFVRDRQSGTTVRVSVSTGGVQGNNDSTQAAISGDGTVVAFTSTATTLVDDDTNLRSDVFVRAGGTTTRVSVSTAGVQGNFHSFQPSLNQDGTLVAFASEASNLVPADIAEWIDIFVRDRQAGTTTRVSVDSQGKESNSPSFAPAISADGRYVAYQSFATNLVSGDSNAAGDIFVHDRQTGAVERVSVDSAGAQGIGVFFGADAPSISGDGRFVGFQSVFANLVPSDTNGVQDVFVRDRLVGLTERVSVDSTGGQANAASTKPALSADGNFVAFESTANNLVTGDSNAAQDIFGRAPVCGDGILDRGEQCDDGNLTDGDGCSSACLLACVAAPADDCRPPALPGKARLLLKDPADDSKDFLIWKWLQGVTTLKQEFGNPTRTDGYLLCLYDGTGLLLDATVPAGGFCGPNKPKPCWKEQKKGFQYKNTLLTPDGILLIKMKEGLENGKPRILIKGKGALLGMPDLGALVSPVTVQLTNSGGICWEAVYSAPFAQQEPGKFKDKAD